MKTAIACLALFALAAPVQGQQIVLGVGGTDFNRNSADDGAFVELEYHSAPLWTLGTAQIGFVGVAYLDDPGDYFLGAGLGVEVPIGSSDWFVEASLVPGYYNGSGDGNDLGNDLEFRSLIGLGYRFEGGWSLSAAVAHMSNAGIGDHNPGVNLGSIRFGRAF